MSENMDKLWTEFEAVGEELVRQKLAGAFGERKAKSAREWLAWKERQRLITSEATKAELAADSIRLARRQDRRQTVALIIAIPAAIVASISIYLYLKSKGLL
jgi:hypothetical protein